MDFLQTHLDFLLAHLLSIAFWAFLIEAARPSRFPRPYSPSRWSPP